MVLEVVQIFRVQPFGSRREGFLANNCQRRGERGLENKDDREDPYQDGNFEKELCKVWL